MNLVPKETYQTVSYNGLFCRNFLSCLGSIHAFKKSIERRRRIRKREWKKSSKEQEKEANAKMHGGVILVYIYICACVAVRRSRLSRRRAKTTFIHHKTPLSHHRHSLFIRFVRSRCVLLNSIVIVIFIFSADILSLFYFLILTNVNERI